MEWSTIISVASVVVIVLSNLAYILYQVGYIKRKLDTHNEDIEENKVNINKIKDGFTRENGTTTYITRREFDKMEQEMRKRLEDLEQANQRANRQIMEALHSLETQLAVINQHLVDNNKGNDPITCKYSPNEKDKSKENEDSGYSPA